MLYPKLRHKRSEVRQTKVLTQKATPQINQVIGTHWLLDREEAYTARKKILSVIY